LGTVMVSNSTLSGNSADLNGGGIDNEGGMVTVSNSILSDNSAHFGGGIYNDLGTVTIQESTLSGNIAANFGGGIYNATSGNLMIESNSTVVGNSPDDLYNLGTADISSDSDVGVIDP
jgi:hypothetical protein